MEEERKKIRLPVEVDDDHGFSIDENRLDESLNRRIDELANEKVANDKMNVRAVIASVLGVFVLGMITVIAIRGAVILTFILIMVGLFNVRGIVDWIEGNE